MRAVQFDRYGSAAELCVSECDRPRPADDEVMIEVVAASVNPLDIRIRRGDLRFITGRKFPKRVGVDVCGRIVERGSKVTSLLLGDEVYALLPMLRGGALADYVCVAANEVCIKPRNIDFAQAASVPLAAMTAFQALHKQAMIRSGQTVLINGASGGVGHFAVQMAKNIGANVIAVSHSSSANFCKSIGADSIISYDREDCIERVQECDVFFDVAGSKSKSAVAPILSPGGQYLTTLPSITQMVFTNALNLFGNKKTRSVSVKRNASDLNAISNLIERKAVNPRVDRIFDVSEIKDAHLLAERGRIRGKIAVLVQAL